MKNTDKLYKMIDELELDELYKIRNIVDSKIKKIEQKTYNEKVLFQKLNVFMEENFNLIEKRIVKPNDFIKTISDITGFEEDDILVADIFEINKSELEINRYYPGEMILEVLNNSLMNYGININYKLNEKQKLFLEEIRKTDKTLVK